MVMEEAPKESKSVGAVSHTGSPGNKSFRIYETKSSNKTKSSTRNELIYKKGDLVVVFNDEDINSEDDWVWAQRVTGGNFALVKKSQLKPYKNDKAPSLVRGMSFGNLQVSEPKNEESEKPKKKLFSLFSWKPKQKETKDPHANNKEVHNDKKSFFDRFRRTKSAGNNESRMPSVMMGGMRTSVIAGSSEHQPQQTTHQSTNGGTSGVKITQSVSHPQRENLSPALSSESIQKTRHDSAMNIRHSTAPLSVLTPSSSQGKIMDVTMQPAHSNVSKEIIDPKQQPNKKPVKIEQKTGPKKSSEAQPPPTNPTTEENEKIFADSTKELPEEILKKVRKAGIPDALLDDHFDILCNILRFTLKKNIIMRNKKKRNSGSHTETTSMSYGGYNSPSSPSFASVPSNILNDPTDATSTTHAGLSPQPSIVSTGTHMMGMLTTETGSFNLNSQSSFPAQRMSAVTLPGVDSLMNTPGFGGTPGIMNTPGNFGENSTLVRTESGNHVKLTSKIPSHVMNGQNHDGAIFSSNNHIPLTSQSIYNMEIPMNIPQNFPQNVNNLVNNNINNNTNLNNNLNNMNLNNLNNNNLNNNNLNNLNKNNTEKKRERSDPAESNVPALRVIGDRTVEQINPKKIFSKVEFMGKGGFGKVYYAKSSVEKKRVAYKKMPFTTPKERRMTLDEVAILAFCKHHNIVSYFRSYCFDNEIAVVMEFMEGGSLSEAVKKYQFEEKHVAFVAKEVLQGIKYLHSNRLVHRDLKSANVMLSTKGDIKLIDFGLTVDIDHCKLHMVGSPFWMPPEMIQCKPHGFAADIWSFSVCCIEMIDQKPPNRRARIKAMFATATEGLNPYVATQSKYSSLFKDFLLRGLEMEPERRSTPDELLRHPFLQGAATQKNMQQVIREIFLSAAFESSGLAL